MAKLKKNVAARVRVVVPVLVSLLCLYRAVLERCGPVGERGLAVSESVEAEISWLSKL
jgi:hypothetical protein